MPQGWTPVAESPKGWTPVQESASPRPEDAFRKATGIGGYPELSAEERRRRERNRPDNSLLGVPPELAVTAVTGIGRAAAQAGLSAMQRLAAGSKAAMQQATPILKYEAVKTGLEIAGVPASIAVPVALVLSGKQSGRGRTPRAKSAPAATASAETAVPVPAAASQPLPAPPAVPSAAGTPAAPSAGSGWSPQRIRNEVGMAARRRGLTLDEAQMAEADALVTQGRAPMDAVSVVAARAQAAAPQKLALNAAESKEYIRLRNLGKSHQEAVSALEQQRALANLLGTPSSERVRASVAERNATGRWPSGEPK